MAIRDNKDYIRVLVYSYYITITGWGVLLRHDEHIDSTVATHLHQSFCFQIMQQPDPQPIPLRIRTAPSPVGTTIPYNDNYTNSSKDGLGEDNPKP